MTITAHPLKGRKQSPEHIAARVAAWRMSSAARNSRFKTLNKERIGQPLSGAHKQSLSVANTGKQNALGVKRSIEFRRKLSDYWAANRTKHNHYIDGKGWERDHERNAAMSRFDYRLWRESVFQRDDWTCVDCGQHGGELQADHIQPWATHVALRYDVANGRTLCAPCHKKTPTYAGRTRSTEREFAPCL